MDEKITRREVLKTVAAGASGFAISKVLPLSTPFSRENLQVAGAQPHRVDERILPLNSTTGVFIPPRGDSFFKFSFDFPEPSVQFEDLQFSFRFFTFENTYALDLTKMTLEDAPDGLHIRSTGLVWAGGQEKCPGRVHARLRKNGAYIEWNVSAEMERPIKSVAAIVRGVPRGKIAAGGGSLFDPGDNELLFGYPFGGGSLFTAREIVSPVAVIQSAEDDYFFMSVLLEQVRANRLYFQPGEKSYRVEMIFEKEGWEKSNSLQSPTWRVGRTRTLNEAHRQHFEHVERAFHVPDWDTREDVPQWLKSVSLVLSIHGMHFTGYIFNDFAKMLMTLEWVAKRIPADRVLVFLPAWDGRYYWNYPLYAPDPRLGGEQGFRDLIQKGQKLGFKFMPMFGLNFANKELPVFSNFADATTAQIDGDAFNLNWVDWDNDRHFEGWGPYMNVGVDSWRRWLSGRISEIIERFHVDAYFLDIAGGWENNTKADMHEGTRRLVTDLRQKFPHVPVCGEMSYDALMSVIPMFHVFQSLSYPAGLEKYTRAFQHMSHPAPGRGSTGAHEYGFSRFDPKTLALNPHQIPTITIVDDTFERYRDVMSEIIQHASERVGIKRQ